MRPAGKGFSEDSRDPRGSQMLWLYLCPAGLADGVQCCQHRGHPPAHTAWPLPPHQAPWLAQLTHAPPPPFTSHLPNSLPVQGEAGHCRHWPSLLCSHALAFSVPQHLLFPAGCSEYWSWLLSCPGCCPIEYDVLKGISLSCCQDQQTAFWRQRASRVPHQRSLTS